MTENTEKQEVKKAPALTKRPAPVKQAAEPSIYIGPTLQGGRLARYTVFKGGVLSPNVAAIAAEHKAIQRLIVPVKRLGEYEKRLADRSSVEAALFAEAGKVFSKGGK